MMNEREDTMDDFTRLEALLLTSSYADLIARDQYWVETQGLSAADFDHQRNTLLQAKVLVQQDVPLPPPGMKARLLQRQRQKAGLYHRKRWLVAACLTAGSLLVFWLGRNSTPPTEKIVYVPEKVVETIYDTIYEDKLIIEQLPPQIIYRDRILRDTIYLMPVAASELKSGKPELLPIADGQEGTALSRSAKETESLLKILVEVY